MEWDTIRQNKKERKNKKQKTEKKGVIAMPELEKNKIHMHICMGALPNCKNIDSYGVICVECNLCGRFDPPKQEKQDKEEMT